jgi:hypothetical protein
MFQEFRQSSTNRSCRGSSSKKRSRQPVTPEPDASIPPGWIHEPNWGNGASSFIDWEGEGNKVSECVQTLTDPGIATLSEVLDPAALAKHLHVISRAPWNGTAVEEVRVRVLKHYHGQRCTLEVGLRTEKGWYFLIGKVYHDDRPDVFQAMEGIRQAGFGPRDEFSIPQPLTYLSSLRLLVQEKVDGPSAGEIFKTGDDENRSAAAERCARWLARFHAYAPRVGQVFYFHRYLDPLRQRLNKIGELNEPLADKAAHLLRRLEDAAAALRPVEMLAGHGSYSGNQVILADRRTVVIDWDGFDVADPARDVGRFLAALRRLALGRLGSIRALDRAADIFLRTYRGVGRPGAEKNVRCFEAAACLKLAMHHLSHPVPRWREKTEAMLQEGLDVLEREVAW